MSLSFEEIADAGISAEKLRPKKPSRVIGKLLLITLLLTTGSILVYFFYFYKLTPSLPESLDQLIVVDATVPDGAMPHQFDEATEFEEALERHKEHYKKPEYRETPLAARAVRAEPTPEDVQTAEVTQRSKQDGFTQWFTKYLEKIKDTWPHLIKESEENKAPTEVASITPSPRSEASQGVQFTTTSEPTEPATNPGPTPANPALHAVELDENATVQIDLVRDWEGLILVPDGIQLARAYTHGVRLNRVEAHPIDGGRLRVWARIENMSNRDLLIETACEFRFKDNVSSPSDFRPSRIPADGALDVYFVSSREGVNAYTLMVKR